MRRHKGSASLCKCWTSPRRCKQFRHRRAAAYPKIRPLIHGAGYPGEKPYNLRLMGMTGAPGDVFGDYSFDRPLEIGQRLLLRDVAPFAAAQSGRGQMHLPFLLTEEL